MYRYPGIPETQHPLFSTGRSCRRDVLDMTTQSAQMQSSMAPPVTGEVEAAAKVLTSLQLAKKNYSLYPENHPICRTALEHFHRLVTSYLDTYATLRLDVGKDRLLLKGQPVCQCPLEEGELPFTLFRDGILWLEFTLGLGAEESRRFLRIINRYNIISTEAEGDIVTAFWEQQLPHITYEVADLFQGAETESATSPQVDRQASATKVLREGSLAETGDPVIDPASLPLSPEEQLKLQEMVRMEEKQPPTAYLDALIDSLLTHQQQDNFQVILEVFEDEFQRALVQGDFDVTLKVLKGLQYVNSFCAPELTWAHRLIEDFFYRISSPQTLSPLQALWPNLNPGQIDQIKELLLFLQPEALQTLGELLLQNPSLRLQKLLLQAMLPLADRDMRPLETLLRSPDENLVRRLMPVLINLKGDRPHTALMRLIRHPATRVRREALGGLLKQGPSRIEEVFKLIDDDDAAIRGLLLGHMGQTRNPVFERLLREHLARRSPRNTDEKHVMACFRTLGQCGSRQSLPFLRQALFARRWLPGFGRPVQRRGAALALHLMGQKEALQLLESARRSLFPGIRKAVRSIMQDACAIREG